jgi:hypothetical protein
MSKEVKPNAEGNVSSVETKSDNISVGELFSRRLAEKTVKVEEKPKAEPKPEPEIEAKEPEPKVESTPEKEEEAPKAEEVPSKNLDLESMSEEELRELAEKLGSRAVARYGELTAKRKQAEERLAALEAQMAQRDAPNPLASDKVEKNPYADLSTIDDLRAKSREVDEAIEWAEDILDSNEHLAYDDVVLVHNGQDITKAKVKQILRDSRKAAKTYLPAQLKEVQASQQREVAEQQMEASARKELSWMEGEDNDTRKQYETLRSSPILQKAVKAVPELKPYMNYMVAHAANSIYGRKSIPSLTNPLPNSTHRRTPQEAWLKPNNQRVGPLRRKRKQEKHLKEQVQPQISHDFGQLNSLNENLSKLLLLWHFPMLTIQLIRVQRYQTAKTSPTF